MSLVLLPPQPRRRPAGIAGADSPEGAPPPPPREAREPREHAGEGPGQGLQPVAVVRHRPRVLVVDDEEDIRDTLADLLSEELGVEVDVAKDGAEGLALALGRRYDLYFVDERMPKLRGTELLQELRKRGLAGRAVLMSAYAEGSIGKDIAAAAGAQEFLRKPLQREHLLRLTAEFLAAATDEADAQGGA